MRAVAALRCALLWPLHVGAQDKKAVEINGDLPEKVRAAWTKAGADRGWMGTAFYGLTFQPTNAKRELGDIPAFRWKSGKPGVIAKLPAPEQPFGLDLRGKETTDVLLDELGHLTHLQAIILDVTSVTDSGLKKLAGVENLQAIDLFGTRITDAGATELSQLQQVRSLGLGGTRITDAGIRALARLKELRTLSLFATAVIDEGVKELGTLPHLHSLQLGKTAVTDQGIRELGFIRESRVLFLK